MDLKIPEKIRRDRPNVANGELTREDIRLRTERMITKQKEFRKRCYDYGARGSIMQWLLQVYESFHFSLTTLALCVDYLDRFTATRVMGLRELKLAAFASVLIASKYNEVDALTSHEMSLMASKSITTKNIYQMELMMLNALQWQVQPPTPAEFLEWLVLFEDDESSRMTLITAAGPFLEDAIINPGVTCYLPSEVATAVILATIENGEYDVQTRRKFLNFCRSFGFTYSKNVRSCRDCLLRSFRKDIAPSEGALQRRGAESPVSVVELENRPHATQKHVVRHGRRSHPRIFPY